MALRGYLAEVKAASTPIAFTDEATTTGDDQIYTITDSNKAIWDLGTAVIVKDGGVPTTEEHKVSRLTGTVAFDSVDGGRVITVTGAYVALTTIVEAKSFSFNAISDALDKTRFQQAFREFQSGNVSGTAELGKFNETTTFFLDMLLDGDIKVIEYYPNSSGDPIRFFALANTRNVESPQAGLQDETISFNITNEIEV